MRVDPALLPRTPALARFEDSLGVARCGLWRDEMLIDLSAADPRLYTFDSLLSLPLQRLQSLLDDPGVADLPTYRPETCELLAPLQSQEVWGAGVTYLRSREARMEEAAAKDLYAQVYEAERPEMFFKAAGWRVVPPGGGVGIRADSDWNVPEPELAILSNSHGEIIAYACGNDMSSRSIEGSNPLYLPQAKTYDASCSLGPVAVLAAYADPSQAIIRMAIERDGAQLFSGSATVADMVRNPLQLAGVLHSCYTLPVGAWLLTGTSLVPDPPYTALPGDRVSIRIEGMGELRNEVIRIPHSGAQAPPYLQGWTRT